VIRAALPHLRAQGGGRVLQISSEGGQLAYPLFSYYHATKWGIEGFVEAVAQEVAPFGIEFTLVEPGPARTSFASGLVRPPVMEVYERSTVGKTRRAILGGSWATFGDASKMVTAMLDVAEQHPAPKRLLLGSDAFDRLHRVYRDRLAALEAQETVARSTEQDRVPM